MSFVRGCPFLKCPLSEVSPLYYKDMIVDTYLFSWTEKLPLITSAEESAWLHHELGRCQLELGNFVEAVDIGRKSLSSAEEASDQMWQLNASMLIAQAKSKYLFSGVGRGGGGRGGGGGCK